MSYIDVKRHGSKIVCWYRDANKQLIKDSYDISDYNYFYIPSPKGKYQSMFGDQVSKIYFKGYREYEDAKEKYQTKFESDISPEYKMLSDEFHDAPNTPLNICLYDIEADFDLSTGKGYPTPENPHGKINSVSMYKSYENEYYMIMFTDDHSIKFTDDEENLKINFYHVSSERQLLDTFLKLIKNTDIISAWNQDGYDVPYIIERLKLNYGEDYATSLLCRDGFDAYVREGKDDFGNDQKQYKLVGRQALDTMLLYKKFTFEEKTSYALNAISEIELKKNKVEYDGDLGELYRTDPHKFFWYSFEDTRILKQMNDKLAHIDLAIQMAREATVRYSDIFGSIKYLEHAIRNYSHFKRTEPVVLPDVKDHEKESFPGAIVLDTKSNVYGWSMSIDLASLYPSVIRALNISPETFTMQCLNSHDDFVKVVTQSDDQIDVRVMSQNRGSGTEPLEVYTLTGKELYEFIQLNGYSISANGSIFTNDVIGLIPEVLGVWYQTRKELKGKMKSAETDDEKSFYDRRQHIMKINLNSLYGAMSNRFCRFYDINIASSVTLTGQEIEKFQTYSGDQTVRKVTEQYSTMESL